MSSISDLDPSQFKHEVQRLSCLTFTGTDMPENPGLARALVARRGGITEPDLHLACCLGDVESVRQHLDHRPQAVSEKGGYHRWEPLIYASYSRFDSTGHSALAVARLLLDRGADVNAHFESSEGYRCSALAGVLGEGELGTEHHPPHPQRDDFARLLLNAGAWPNDGQAIYNSMFTTSTRTLELLFEFGLADPAKGQWPVYMDELVHKDPMGLLRIPLYWAVSRGNQAPARLLIDHGVHHSFGDDPSIAHRTAMRCGEPSLAEYIVDHGGQRSELSLVERLASACMAGQRSAVHSLLDQHPDLKEVLVKERPNAVAEAAYAGRIKAVQIYLELGLPVAMQPPSRSPLHQAAFEGHLDIVKLLVEAGADVHERDPGNNATARQWAAYRDHRDVIDFLAQCEADPRG